MMNSIKMQMKLDSNSFLLKNGRSPWDLFEHSLRKTLMKMANSGVYDDMPDIFEIALGGNNEEK